MFRPIAVHTLALALACLLLGACHDPQDDAADHGHGDDHGHAHDATADGDHGHPHDDPDAGDHDHPHDEPDAEDHGHAHGEARADDQAHAHGEGEEIEPAVVTVFGERVLLFMEHPRLVVGEAARFLAHFSVLADGAPVRTGQVELVVGDTRLTAAAPARDGLFTPQGAFPTAGRFPAGITVTGEQVTERLDLGTVVVHADTVAARHAAEAATGDDPPDAVPFLMEQQWKVGLLLAEAHPRDLVEHLVVPAEVVAAHGAAAHAAAPAGGRLLPPTTGSIPHAGERVEAGQELAVVEPPLSSADAAQLRALDLQWSLEALAVERDFADATARLRFAESEHDRLARLRPSGLTTQQQVEQAERDRDLARGQLDAAEAGREALQALRDRGDQQAWSDGGTLRLRVLAPIAGEIEAAGPVPGEAVEAGESIFRIVDRSRLWVEGRISEFDLPRLAGAGAATVTLPAIPDLDLSVAPLNDTGPLLLGNVVDPSSRTLLLRGALPEPPDAVRPGMLADLNVAVASSRAAVAIPAEAVVLDQGLPTAYVMLGGETFQRRSLVLGGETFQRRSLVLGLRDGGWVEVREGVEAGEHVATRSAATIRMAALSPSDFGHGHAH